MKDETILLLLERLNRGDITDTIVAPIGKRVFWGFVYDSIEESWESENITPEKGNEFFFVKSASGKFAAAVYRMGKDEIHWVVAKRYRRKRILVNPLKKVILPFIFAYHQEIKQQGTVKRNNSSAVHSAKLAERVGFTKIKSSEFEDVYEISNKLTGKYRQPHRKTRNATEIKKSSHAAS